MSDTSAFNGTILKTNWNVAPRYTDDASLVCDDDDVAAGVIFQVPEDCDLTHANVLCKAVTGTQPYFKAKLWPMSTTTGGQPDTSGTVLAETAAYQNSLGLNKVAFTSAYSATQGEVVACVFEYESGTIDGSNKCDFEYIGGRGNYHSGVNGILLYRTSGSATYSSNGSYFPSVCVTTDKDYDVGGTQPHGYSSLGSDVAGHRFCQKFTLPADRLLELHCIGIEVNSHQILNSTDTAKVGAWDAAGDDLIDLNTLDADQGYGATAGEIGFYLGPSHLYFAETLTMVSGGVYYLGIEALSGWTKIEFLTMGDDYDAMQRGYPGMDWCQVSKWDGSSWDDDFNAGATGTPGRALISPILSDIHGVAGGGGGSSISAPSMGLIG